LARLVFGSFSEDSSQGVKSVYAQQSWYKVADAERERHGLNHKESFSDLSCACKDCSKDYEYSFKMRLNYE
jgi:hypothetical protein